MEDGDYFFTRFNGTAEEAKRYYIGQVFNMGTMGDKMVKCINIEVIQ